MASSSSPRYHVFQVLTIVLVLGSISVGTAKKVKAPAAAAAKKLDYPAFNCRKHTALLTDFGAVGDGKTLNTKAFQSAIANLSKFAADGGSQLIVPPGKWLTGSFNLTSHFTLFLHKDAVILASQDEANYPVIPPLPSYGQGGDVPNAGRYASLIYGNNLTDIVITGNNGTIDGQGKPWWDKFEKKKIKASRPYLIEILFSQQVQITNITLTNSPCWHVHPVYSKDVLIQKVTILAPVDVPNTDGINPDSCTNTKIEDCYIVSGDDCIAVKSGWDQYGIKFARPLEHLVVRRVTCISPDSAAIAIGSEMSGGISDVRAEDVVAINTQSGIRIKSARGRGGYVKDIFARRWTMKTMKYVFWMTSNYKTHPDNGFDIKALPNISGIYYKDMTAENVTYSARLEGLNDDPFTGICISNVSITLSPDPKKLQWNCTDISGVTSKVTPKPCALLPEKGSDCRFPEDKLAIDTVQLKTCSTGQ